MTGNWSECLIQRDWKGMLTRISQSSTKRSAESRAWAGATPSTRGHPDRKQLNRIGPGGSGGYQVEYKKEARPHS